MLLLQENTCAHRRHWWSTSGLLCSMIHVQLFDLLLCRGLTLPQMGQGDGSFRYLVPSSPLASGSSLFMCFGPIQKQSKFSSAKSLRWIMVTWRFFAFIAFTEDKMRTEAERKRSSLLCATHPHRASCGAPASRLCGRTSCCRFHRNTASRHASSCAWIGCCWWRRSASKYRTGTSCHLEREEEWMKSNRIFMTWMWSETSFKKGRRILFSLLLNLLYFFYHYRFQNISPKDYIWKWI